MEFPTYSSGLEDNIPSYYDYIESDECTGFGLNFMNLTAIKIQPHLDSLLSRFIILFIHPLVAVLGALGNLIFMFSVWKLPSMKNSINLILLNLSFADLLYLLVGTGEKFVRAINLPVRGTPSFLAKFFIVLLSFHI